MSCEQSAWNAEELRQRQAYMGRQDKQPEEVSIQMLLQTLADLLNTEDKAIDELENRLEPILSPRPDTVPKGMKDIPQTAGEPALMVQLRSMIVMASANVGTIAGLRARVRL